MKKLIINLLDWARCTLAGPPKPKRLELKLLPYGVADDLLRKDKSWRVAPEEDTNTRTGFVYLERVEAV